MDNSMAYINLHWCTCLCNTVISLLTGCHRGRINRIQASKQIDLSSVALIDSTVMALTRYCKICGNSYNPSHVIYLLYLSHL